MKGSDITPEPVEQEWYIQIQERCTSIMDDVEAAISNIQLSADQIESNKNSIEALSEELAELKNLAVMAGRISLELSRRKA